MLFFVVRFRKHFCYIYRSVSVHWSAFCLCFIFHETQRKLQGLRDPLVHRQLSLMSCCWRRWESCWKKEWRISTRSSSCWNSPIPFGFAASSRTVSIWTVGKACFIIIFWLTSSSCCCARSYKQTDEIVVLMLIITTAHIVLVDLTYLWYKMTITRTTFASAGFCRRLKKCIEFTIE